MNNKIYFHYDQFQNKFLIRPIIPSDKEYLKIGMQNLSNESRHQRFHSGKKELSSKELSFLTEVDMINHIAYVTSLNTKENDIPSGVIRGIRSNKDPKKLEIAVTIVDSYQGRGLGKALLKILANKSKEIGYTHFVGDLHNSNHKMLHLLQTFSKKSDDLQLTHIGEGFLYFELCLS